MQVQRCTFRATALYKGDYMSSLLIVAYGMCIGLESNSLHICTLGKYTYIPHKEGPVHMGNTLQE